MSATVSALFECAVCFEHYNATTNVPVTFPCGHSCCLQHSTEIKVCHVCRAKIPTKLGVNVTLRDLAVEFEAMSLKERAEVPPLVVASNSTETAATAPTAPAYVPPSLMEFSFAIECADELMQSPYQEGHVVAYYCRLHVVNSTLSALSTPSEEETMFINDQLDRLEELKLSCGLSDSEGRRICAQHANAVFSKANEADRAAMPDSMTCRLYRTAETCFSMLKQFGDLDKETELRMKIATSRTSYLLTKRTGLAAGGTYSAPSLRSTLPSVAQQARHHQASAPVPTAVPAVPGPVQLPARARCLFNDATATARMFNDSFC